MYFKYAIVFFISLFSISVFAQDFRKIDIRARKAPKSVQKDFDKLNEHLIGDFKTDLEKIRSIYTWIIHNIAYDNSAYKNGRKRINHSNQDILNRRQAVCFGYASLFKAMCAKAGIRSEVIEGYIKNPQSGVADITSMNHAWSAAEIDNQWYLFDLTWDSGSQDKQAARYFMISPEEMILSHLPGNPMWQLLDCPINPAIFRKTNPYIKAHLQSAVSCFSFKDSIEVYFQLDPVERKLKNIQDQYSYNPVQENKEELGHSYMDQVSLLHDRAAALELTDSIEAIKSIHLQIIETCQKATQYIDLYDHQKENLAYSHINYAVILSRSLPGVKKKETLLGEMLNHFEKASQILKSLPSNLLIENALEQIDFYIKWVEEY